MTEINAKSGVVTTIGKQGENVTTKVIFDIPDGYEEYAVSAMFKRADLDEPYPIAVQVIEGKVEWIVTSTELFIPGFAQIEIQYQQEDEIKKSVTYRLKVIESLHEPSEEPPDPFKDWYSKVLDASNKAIEAGNEADTTLEKVKEIASTVKTEGEEAVKDISTAKKDATESISNAKKDALDGIENKQGAALKAISDKQTEAEKSISENIAPAEEIISYVIGDD